MDEACDALTEKEKETLRLMVRGHDAKSMANALSLSVHTINERLRAARRKLDVTSSREAARLLFESEAGPHEKIVDESLGGASTASLADNSPIVRKARSRGLWIGGIVLMFGIAIIAAITLTHPAPERAEGDPATPLETVQLTAFEATAREWLKLVDAYDWEASFAAAGRPFRDPNTASSWREASEQVRVPLGALVDRKIETVGLVQSGKDNANAEERVVVTFKTQFENRSGVSETVTLEQEHGEWRVMGYMID